MKLVSVLEDVFTEAKAKRLLIYIYVLDIRFNGKD